jgi:hypothetical protein
VSGATPIRLPLSQRQAEALAKALDEVGVGPTWLTHEDFIALREVAEKLGTLKGETK